MKLIDGKGQLGEALKKAKIESDWTIYHTWDFIHKKDWEIQKKCFVDFVYYIENHLDEKICFISTLSQGNTPYVRYKKLAEEFLKNSIKDYKIIRICGIIGKGVCEKFRNDEIEPEGEMTLTSLYNVINMIKFFLGNDRHEFNILGSKIQAEIVNELILFGKNGKPTV